MIPNERYSQQEEDIDELLDSTGAGLDDVTERRIETILEKLDDSLQGCRDYDEWYREDVTGILNGLTDRGR